MLRATLALLAAAAIAAVVFLVPAQASTPKLVGTVGPGYTITLKKGATKVKTLKAGKYTFVISDKASIHNFTVEQQTGGKFEKTLTGTSFSSESPLVKFKRTATESGTTALSETDCAAFTKSIVAKLASRIKILPPI